MAINKAICAVGENLFKKPINSAWSGDADNKMIIRVPF